MMGLKFTLLMGQGQVVEAKRLKKETRQQSELKNKKIMLWK